MTGGGWIPAFAGMIEGNLRLPRTLRVLAIAAEILEPTVQIPRCPLCQRGRMPRAHRARAHNSSVDGFPPPDKDIRGQAPPCTLELMLPIQSSLQVTLPKIVRILYMSITDGDDDMLYGGDSDKNE